MPTDGAIAKFLYTILKQLDLKSIDWNNVASQLDITNGHAARMRFSRFRQQMEGIPAAPRKPRSAVPRTKKPKPRKPPKSESRDDDPPPVKAETEPMEDIQRTIKPEPIVKEEPYHEHGNLSSAPRNSASIGPAPHQMSPQSGPFWSQEDIESMRSPPNVKPEPGSNVYVGDLQAMSSEGSLFLAKEDSDKMWPPRIIKLEPLVKMEPSWNN